MMSNLSASQKNFVVTNPHLPDHPIVFASPGFYELTGYSKSEVIGRNCRFLQGPATDSRTVEKLRHSIEMGTEVSVRLQNYKADGTPFLNQLFMAPLRNSNNEIVNFIGVQCEVEPNDEATIDTKDQQTRILEKQEKILEEK